MEHPNGEEVQQALENSQNNLGISGATPFIGPIMPWNPKDITWKKVDNVPLNYSLKDIQNSSASLKDASKRPGAAYQGTKITETEAQYKILEFGRLSKGLLDPINNNTYQSNMARYIPYMNKTTELTQNRLAGLGINTGRDFEKFIVETKSQILNNKYGDRAPLDFTNPPADAKITSISSRGNFTNASILSKILRNDIGNNKSNFSNVNNYKKAFASRSLKGIELYQSANQGIVPNFADYRTRSQKIKDYLNDPANKNVKFKRPANITPTQISMAMNVPVGGNVTKEYSDNEIKKAILETIQKRKDLQLEGFENLDNVDVNSVLKKYKESIKGGKYYGNKDLSYSSGLVPNFVDKVQNGKDLLRVILAIRSLE